MSKALVIVESPAKMKTIRRYLGEDYIVESSIGHVKDLPKTRLGVDLENDFKPEYLVIDDKKKVMQKLKKAAKSVDEVYLALDPDREGEAIAWHIAEELQKSRGFKGKIFRILFHEITKRAILEAITKPTELNKNRFDAQQARRILDRLVGYQISPILWEKVKRGLSAGRVQSVAVRLVVDREREIQRFVKEEFWSISALLEGHRPPAFSTKLIRFEGKKIKIPDEKEATRIVDYLSQHDFSVRAIKKKERKRNPTPPFITSKLQQEAARKLNFTAKRTMMVAQQLYEGIELGASGATGLITYMRTDSTRISEDALKSVRHFIKQKYGKDYLPARANSYAKKKGAQDAHEAIRPTSMELPPEKVAPFLKKEQLDLYSLIWKRFVASQMKPAIFDQTSIDIEAGQALLRATGQTLRFDGFMRVYTEGHDENGAEAKAQLDPEKMAEQEAKTMSLPDLSEGESLKVLSIKPQQHFTQPPPRFRESSLVKELEEKGIGRPSTYASILSVIQDKGYVEKKNGSFVPTELGYLITDLLTEHFPQILDVQFTANMEESLDQIEQNGEDWIALLHDFHEPFVVTLDKAKEEMPNIKREGIKTGIKCEKCGREMVIKWGRNGQFLACSGYPECKNTKDYVRTEDGKIVIVEPDLSTTQVSEKCPNCGSPMLVKNGRYGRFLACSAYPECKTTMPYPVGVDCPEEGCDGYLVEKRAKKGSIYYSCSNYPDCKYRIWDRPIPEPCPVCHHPFLTEVTKKRKNIQPGIVCPSCGYRKEDLDD